MKRLELATLSDYEAVNRINRQVNDLHVGWRPDIFCHSDCGYPMDFFQQAVDQKLMYVARIDGNVIGYVRFVIWQTGGPCSVPSKVLDIDDFCVDESCRHQGIGIQMMEDVKELARELGCNDIQLSVYPQNENAVAFYEKCGFQVRNVRYQMYV